MLCREFFKDLYEAVAWANSMGDRVYAVYGISRTGTKMRFYEEKMDAESYGIRTDGMTAVVLYVR